MIFLERGLIFFLLAAITGSPRDAANWIQAENLKARMQFLANEDLEGRNAGSHEGRIAADYIASEFMRMGLKPMGDADTYFQNFDTVRVVIDERNTSLTIKSGTSEKVLLHGSDFYSGWEPQTNTPIEVTAPVVFAGYGIDAPEYAYNDLAGIDVHGKIVLILSREPQSSDPNSKFKGKWDTLYAYSFSKAEQLRKAGAAGILMIDPGKPQRPPRLESGPPDYLQPGTPRYSQSLTSDRWDTPFFDVTEQAANELLKPAGKTVAELQQSIDQNYRPNSFDIPGTTVTMRKAFTDRKILHMRNVAGLLEGSDPNLKAEAVVISAHYDHGGVIGDRIYPGADDNASGTIGVLEIARAYVRGEIKPRRSILFIVFDAEERGLLGSFYYIDHPLIPLDRTAANLNMDMIGRDEETPTWHTTPEQNRNSVNITGSLYDPGLRSIIENDDKAIGLKLDYKTDTDDPENWFARSDHYPFATKSVPMVLFTTGEHADYHTENDKWDRIDYPKMEKIVRLIFLSSVDVANASERIKFTP